ncbi:MAG: DUF4199 domain-containing protein [Mucilaginibacter sp.]
MKKNVLVFGIISGLIAAFTVLTSIETGYSNMWVGYGGMIVAFSLIFVGIKNLRDKFNGGFISFGKAFKTGLLIALIGSTIYMAAWMIDYYSFHPDYMQKYAASVINEAKASGASPAEIKKEKAQMATYIEMYKNPLMIMVFTYLEILPVGLIIALIAALMLKRKPVNSQAAAAA